MGNHTSGAECPQIKIDDKEQPPQVQASQNPLENWDSFSSYIEQLNFVLQSNKVYLKANFDIENLRLEIAHSESNILPLDFRKKVFHWCGSGTLVLVKIQQAGGIEGLQTYETVKDFLKAIGDLDETLIYLRDINMDFKKQVIAQRINGTEADIKSDSDFNICSICLLNSIEMALPCGHSFCDKCISDWRKKQKTCPLCRTEVKSSAYVMVGDIGL